MNEANPYEATKHLAERHEAAWRFDRLPEEDSYRTDGLIMVRRDAVDPERMEAVPYEPDRARPMADEGGASRVWESATDEPLHQVHVTELVNVRGNCSYFATYEMLAVLEPTNAEGGDLYLNAHKLRLACYWTRADMMMAKCPRQAVVLYRDGEPVALVMPVLERPARGDISAAKEQLREAGS